MTTRTTALGLILLSAVAVTVPACSSTTPGTPLASAASTPPTTTSTGQPSEQGGGTLADLDPCSDMLTSAAKSDLGITDKGKPDDVGPARGCKWLVRGPEYTLILSVGLYDALGIDDLPDDINNKPLPDINGRKAVQSHLSTSGGDCAVTIAVTKTTRASANAVAGVDRAKACQLAGKIAELIEPQLPRS
ncbi:DUF3558 domain-containing protein [Actinokineospora auranticolor]|uniref:Uncharacterized protein DUF3558 n=1 Tax=Actinokineospora auranticolor TaxID=155976 RepID=A0A2S6GBV5_9PSEU|nr:DUF3558 domain-containing protein [Actinokineospora auranticolor]PPK61342.1 uncharacterized protein DUF3558 [Actinokineospora auranticolor]